MTSADVASPAQPARRGWRLSTWGMSLETPPGVSRRPPRGQPGEPRVGTQEASHVERRARSQPRRAGWAGLARDRYVGYWNRLLSGSDGMEKRTPPGGRFDRLQCILTYRSPMKSPPKPHEPGAQRRPRVQPGRTLRHSPSRQPQPHCPWWGTQSTSPSRQPQPHYPWWGDATDSAVPPAPASLSFLSRGFSHFLAFRHGPFACSLSFAGAQTPATMHAWIDEGWRRSKAEEHAARAVARAVLQPELQRRRMQDRAVARSVLPRPHDAGGSAIDDVGSFASKSS